VRFARVSHRIYVSLVLVALLSILGAGIVTHALLDRTFEGPGSERLRAEAEYVARVLPPAGAAPAETERLLAETARGLKLHALLLGTDGQPIASTLHPAPRLIRPPLAWRTHGPAWVPTSHGHALALRLADGRTLAVWSDPAPRVTLFLLVVFFGLLSAFCVPVARGLTRRLEALEQGVAELGSGRLGTRVPVVGHDEIARLAERFNWSAERVERLVESQRRMLLAASHELRSPLARVRMALELVRDAGGAPVEPRVAEAVAEIGELDALVDDLLLASRLEVAEPPERKPVDLSSIVREEAARVGASEQVESVSIAGDARLLRRLVRNLLENAVRHGRPPVVAGVTPVDGNAGEARLWVSDAGPGVGTAERERVFEPFFRGARATDASGVGLGLALVRQIAEHHGGRASCRGQDGAGATFEVVLPRLQG
jgi:signal transduction histidine kinase